jgi:hypothetical protein
MYKSNEMCALMGMPPEQLLKFIAIQKSMDRKVLMKTAQDLLRYRAQFYERHKEQWLEILQLWREAGFEYYYATAQGLQLEDDIDDSQSQSHSQSNTQLPFSIDRLLTGLDDLLRTPLTIALTINQLDFNINLKTILEYSNQWLTRRQTVPSEGLQKGDKKEIRGDSAIEELRNRNFLANTEKQLRFFQEKLIYLKNYFDYLQCKVNCDMTSGTTGSIDMHLSNVICQSPVAWATKLQNNYLSSGFAFPMPYVIQHQNTNDGNIIFEVSIKHACIYNSIE